MSEEQRKVDKISVRVITHKTTPAVMLQSLKCGPWMGEIEHTSCSDAESSRRVWMGELDHVRWTKPISEDNLPLQTAIACCQVCLS